MDISQKHSRRNILKTGLAAAAVATLPISRAKAQRAQRGNILTEWVPKKPGEIRISAFCQDEPQVLSGLRPLTNIENVTLYWAGNNTIATPEMIRDTDIMATFYSGYLYSDENRPVIIEEITKRGMAWFAIHNSCWQVNYLGDKELSDFLGAYAMLHREVQPVTISRLNQNHPITKGIEPFVIPLDEQFGVYLADPKDPDVTVLFSGQGLHDQHWTIQGWAAQRGKGRIVGMLPGHQEWTWREPYYAEMTWRAFYWMLNRPIEPSNRSYDNYVW